MADSGVDSGLRERRIVGDLIYRDLYAAHIPHEQPGVGGHGVGSVEEKLVSKPRQSPYTINNALWMVASIAVFYYTDFALALMYDPRVHRIWLKLGLGFIGVNICVGTFLIVYLSWIKKIPSERWEVKYPAAIPIATAAFIIGSFCLTVALWPIWHIFTPVILFVLFMGVVVLIAIIPNF